MAQETLLNFEIDEDLKQDFKIWCIKNNTDMKTTLTDYIKQKLGQWGV